jgi:predicted transposase/invertase (TIGR01784 family)
MSEKWIDRAWKDILIGCLDDAIAFFMPDLAADRDYSQKPEILTEEMPAIGASSDKDMKVSDVCASLLMKNATIQRVALLIEQQHWPHKDFAQKVFEEYYRSTDRLRIPVTALVIFTGTVEIVSTYTFSCYGTELSFNYNIYSIPDADVEALRYDKRLFATVVLAGVLMLKAGKDPRERERYARELMKLMLDRNYERDKIKIVLDFVGKIFRVEADDIDAKFKEEWKMHWIPWDEAVKEIYIRHASEEGVMRGMTQGKLEMAHNLLNLGISPDQIAQASGLTEEEIRRLN